MKLEKLLQLFRAVVAVICLIFAIFGLLYDFDSAFKNLTVFAIALLAGLLCIKRVRHRFAPTSLHRPIPAGVSVLTLSAIYMVMLGAFSTPKTTPIAPISDVIAATSPQETAIDTANAAAARETFTKNKTKHVKVRDTLATDGVGGTAYDATIRNTHPDIGQSFLCRTSKPYDANKPMYTNWTLRLTSNERISLQNNSSSGSKPREYKVTGLQGNRLVAKYEDRIVVTFNFDTQTMSLGAQSDERNEEAQCERYNAQANELQKRPYIVSLRCTKNGGDFHPRECMYDTIKIRDKSGYREYTPEQFLDIGVIQGAAFTWTPEGNFGLSLWNVSGPNADLLVTVIERQTSKQIYSGKVEALLKLNLSCATQSKSCTVS